MAVTQVSDLNSLFNTIYEGALFVAREQNLMLNLVDVRDASGWMDRKIAIRPAISAASVNETQDYSSPTTFGASLKATISPSEVIAQGVLTDRDLDTDPYGAARDLAVEMGGAISTKIDTDLLGLFTSFTIDKGTGAGNSATVATLGAAVAYLTTQKALQYGALQGVFHPYQYHDFWVALGQPAATYANLDSVTVDALKNYFVGDLLGVNLYRSANITIDGSADAIGAVFVRPSMMIDFRRRPRVETERDASARATEFNITAGYGVGIVRDEFGVKYTCDATAP